MRQIIDRIKVVVSHRELLLRLAIKDQKTRYRSQFLGFLWAFLLPLFMMLIYGLVFSVIMKVRIENYPFLVYIVTAIFPWSFFQGSVSSATTCISEYGDLFKKVRFPRELIPLSIVIANLISFLFNLIVLVIFLASFKIRFTVSIFFLPLVVILHVILTIGVALTTASLQVRYRDLKYILELTLQALFFLTPVFYPLSMVADNLPGLLNTYLLNPFVGIVNLYRACLLGNYLQSLPGEVNPFNTLIIPVLSSISFLILGFWIFRRQEPAFSDYL
jgi:ABC-2 type transport system permease protein